ncbi:tetratricopeptide repeat protein, partial [Streptomyces lavendulae]|uniref:tetratricopeptide repeat protein n=1 Tax=Streptomyces lavendulae TaxID=1914 RepID=UPI0033F59AA3
QPHRLRSRTRSTTNYAGISRINRVQDSGSRPLTDYTRIFGADHPDTHLARANLAGTYRHLGRHHDALLLEEQVLAARIRLLGDDHPETHRARANLAATYNDLSRHNDALPLAEQVLAARVRLLGDDHPHTARARAILATTHRFLGPPDPLT